MNISTMTLRSINGHIKKLKKPSAIHFCARNSKIILNIEINKQINYVLLLYFFLLICKNLKIETSKGCRILFTELYYFYSDRKF